MIKLFATKQFHQSFLKLPKIIQKKADKQTQFFKQNSNHPSLRIEKLKPKNLDLWSMRIDKEYRVIFSFTENDVVILRDIGKHDKMYRKI